MPLALYRKHRPRRLDEIVGQELNVSILKNAAAQNRLAHAYLFYGPRGTGKTSTARLIAKLLNCQKRATDKNFAKEGEPCNDCLNCHEIDTGRSVDVIEIDAASNRGIDEIRNLKEIIRTSPHGAAHKVFIIDEAHMLTPQAWNALLKTLEEPPAHGAIIMATTEYEKIPSTITSRAQRFLFKKLTKQQILAKLEEVAVLEKIKIELDALELIAAAAEGSLRDAQSLLDQVASFKETVDIAFVENITGRVGLKKIETLARYISAGDIKTTLVEISHLADEGQNMAQVTRDLIHYLRKVLGLRLNSNLQKFYEMELTQDEIKSLQSISSASSPEKLTTLIKALIRAYAQIRYSPFASIPLEIALIENMD